MRALIDTNIILDFVTKREPYYNDAKKVLKAFTNDINIGLVSIHSLSDIWYLLRKQSNDDRRRVITFICTLLTSCSTNHQEVKMAIKNLDFNDFEDCLQDSCAYVNKCDYIITRNLYDYRHSRVKAISLKEAIKILS